MLNHIPKLLSSELVKHLMDMGHGDEIVIADGNYPASSMGVPVVHLDGHNVPEVLDAILELMPLDAYVDSPWALMEVIPGDSIVPVVWEAYRKILRSRGCEAEPQMVERYAFYERGRRAFCVAATSEQRQYANVILKKGIVK